MSHFESAADNFIQNVDFLRETNNTIEIRKMCKFYAVDMISKYIFAVDCDSFKQERQNSEFAKLALRVGDVKLTHILLLNFTPKSLWKWLNLNIFDVKPLDRLGDLFKKMIRQRDPSLRYSDLTELFQDQIREGKLDGMSEDAIIANCLMSYLAGADATSSVLTRVFYYLISETAVRERLQDELRRDFRNGITYEALMEHQVSKIRQTKTQNMFESLLVAPASSWMRS